MSKLYQIPVRDSENSNLIKFISVTETIYVAIRRETGRIRKKLRDMDSVFVPEAIAVSVTATVIIADIALLVIVIIL